MGNRLSLTLKDISRPKRERTEVLIDRKAETKERNENREARREQREERRENRE